MTARRVIAAVLLATLLNGCLRPVVAVGIKVLYRKTDLPAERTHENICYAPDNACDASDRRKLDLYLPEGKDWPVLIFVHGGGWTSGDKQLRVTGADVYSNIGRFYAAHGIGTAVINYGLQPQTNWQGQVDDVRLALAWVRREIAAYGGRPDDIYLMGHSAGAYLASYVALRGSKDARIPYLKGVVSVSGAALDISDQRTYDLGEKPVYYETRFRGNDTTDEWKRVASPVTHASPNAPPFLVMYAAGETKRMERQSQLLDKALKDAGAQSTLLPIPGESHARVVLVLSRADKKAAPAILKLIKETSSN